MSRLLIALLALVSSPTSKQSLVAAPLITFTNPTPAVSDAFGISMTPLGSDRVLIGAHQGDAGVTNAGAAYLFSTNGMLLTTFTNPSPADGDRFGWAIAAIGTNRVVVGAYRDDTSATNSGEAYLFSDNGTLLTTFTNPTPASGDNFGYSVAALGTDRVLIGALLDDTGGINAGAAYLFSTNGTLLMSFIVTGETDALGTSLAAVGEDHLIIGAPTYDAGSVINAGIVYLFSANGSLVTTFTNPTPAMDDRFGATVVAFGNDRILITALGDDTGAINVGAAYLFSTNGILLTTFTNPTPATGDNFGWSSAPVGEDWVLIGAPVDDSTGTDAGAAYLFTTNGTLLCTFTENRAPEAFFGHAVAAVGNHSVLIGAWGDDSGATNAGAAFLIQIPFPTLKIARSNSTVFIEWVADETGLILQQTSTLGFSAQWSEIAEPITRSGATNRVQQTISPTNHFYRLRRL